VSDKIEGLRRGDKFDILDEVDAILLEPRLNATVLEPTPIALHLPQWWIMFKSMSSGRYLLACVTSSFVQEEVLEDGEEGLRHCPSEKLIFPEPPLTLRPLPWRVSNRLL
jgi:hypothetical protein